MTYQESLKYEALLRDYAAGKITVEEVRRGIPKAEPKKPAEDPTMVDTSEVGSFQTVDVETYLLTKGVLTSEQLEAIGAK